MKSVQLNGKPVYPSKICCVGRNFVAHIEELGNETPSEMVIFLKPNSAIGSTLHARLDGESIHYEAELCFLVKQGKLAAVGVGLDLTKRSVQSRLKEKGLPWERAKAFDGAVLLSEFITLEDDIESLSIQLEVDGVQRQSGGVALMMYKPRDILEELQAFISLEDGDIIMTGTPAGVGEVRTGETFSAAVIGATERLVGASWTAQ